MADATDRYALPLLQSGQSQKEVTHNEALIRLDALLHLAVEGQASDAPSLPEPGQCWIVVAPASGAWTEQEGRIAQYHAGGWNFVEPVDGCLAWIKGEAVFAYRSGGEWRSDAWPVKGLKIDDAMLLAPPQPAIADPASGSVVDAEARMALVQILAALRQHGLIEI